jgi:hypothetical protein
VAEIPPNATTVKVSAISPVNVLLKDNKEPKTPDLTVQDATTVNKADTWQRTAPRIKPKRNATTAERSDTFPEIALKEETERRPLSATNVTKPDISPKNAIVILK